MNLLWKTESGNQTSFERQFIEELFESNGSDQKEFERLNRKNTPVVAIFSSNDRVVTKSLLEYIKSESNLHLVHLNNESLMHHESYYRYSCGVRRS
jgi:hypothetical protein